jgi:signal transduction histidine kinase
MARDGAAPRRTPPPASLLHPAEPLSRNGLRRHIFLVTLGLLMTVLAGAAALLTLDLRQTERQAELAAGTAQTLARQMERSLRPAITAMTEARDELLASATMGEALRERVAALLGRAADDHHVVISYGLLDPEGRVIASSAAQVPPGTSLAARPFFQAALAAPAGEIVIAPPHFGALGLARGKPMFALVQRVADPAGETRGVIGANISVAYIADALGVIASLGQGSADLLGLDGTLLASSFQAGDAAALPTGHVPPPGPAASWAAAGAQGWMRLATGREGAQALVAWQRVAELPALVRVAMPSRALWLGLSRNGLAVLAFAALLCAVLLAGARLLRAEARGREAAEGRSARRLSTLVEVSAGLQDAIEPRDALRRIVRGARRLLPALEVRALLIPGDGGEVIVHGEKPAGGQPMGGDAAPQPSAWLSLPLRGDAGEYLGVLEVFGPDVQAIAAEDRAALQQVAALGEAALRRGRLLTHLSAAAAEAEAARAELERICDTIHDGFCALDRAGRFTYANPAAARLLGVEARQLLGRTLPELLPEAGPGLAAALARPARQEREIALPIGRYALLRLVPSGNGFALFLRDVTIAREAEQLRRTAERLEALGALTGGVAHDFNNLLTVVIGNAEALAEALEDRPDLARSAGLILGAAERAAALIRRMMAFARRQPLSPAPTDVAALVEDLLPLLRQSVGERVRLLLRLEPGLPPALVDPVQLENALLNLALNARDAMPEGGTLRIELAGETLDAAALAEFSEAAPGDFLRLSVTDDGQGMPPEVARRAFEPFFTTKSPGAGSGLGLATVYGFVRQSRGCIGLDTAPGRGTSVILHLPAAVAAPAQPAPAAPEPAPVEAQPPASEGLAPLHVLVVEDQAALREQIAGMLRELGHSATLAAEGEAALALLRGGLRPDVLLSDVVLPGGMDGAAVMRQAQALLPGLPAILMSGFAAQLYDASGALPEGLRLLEKPFRRQDLARRLQLVAGQRARPGGPPPAHPMPEGVIPSGNDAATGSSWTS